MTFLRILALVYVARLTILGLEALFGEPYTRVLLLGIVCTVIWQHWRER